MLLIAFFLCQWSNHLKHQQSHPWHTCVGQCINCITMSQRARRDTTRPQSYKLFNDTGRLSRGMDTQQPISLGMHLGDEEIPCAGDIDPDMDQQNIQLLVEMQEENERQQRQQTTKMATRSRTATQTWRREMDATPSLQIYMDPEDDDLDLDQQMNTIQSTKARKTGTLNTHSNTTNHKGKGRTPVSQMIRETVNRSNMHQSALSLTRQATLHESYHTDHAHDHDHDNNTNTTMPASSDDSIVQLNVNRATGTKKRTQNVSILGQPMSNEQQEAE